MIPKKFDAHEYDYPDFQPDQILSADHLNHSFAYNEQQERLTRANLLGIGIACGLKATKSADNKTITITKGTGITSQGYLVVQGVENSEIAIEYKKYRKFNALQDIKYDVFVSGLTEKYVLWELLDATTAKPEDLELNTGFLLNKVCLLFVEQLEVEAKNCDTTSCDDKGKTVNVSIRKLLVDAVDADKIILACNANAGSNGSGETFPGITGLKEIKIPRFNVAATLLGTSSDVFEAYQKVFTKNFVETTGNALNAAYYMFKSYLKDTSNPFAGFNTNFSFLHNGTINGNKLLHFQYYYDFFYDILQAYNEWRSAALEMVALCTPPAALFPRHLFLGNLSETEGIEKSKYRNYFLPSPILSNHEKLYKKFKSLFQRLVRMVANQTMPLPVDNGTGNLDTNIRITPSLNGNVELGLKSIPYYYKANEAAGKLLDVWNDELSRRGKQSTILHYNPVYSTEDFVKYPLKYDLEPYNFLRVEGHIGKPIVSVLYNLEKLRSENRLPFQYVALAVDGDEGIVDLKDAACHFEDLEAMYKVLSAELLCRMLKLLMCLYRQPKYVTTYAVYPQAYNKANIEETAARSIEETIVPNKIAIGLRPTERIVYNENTMGQVYEDLKPSLGVKRTEAYTIMNGYGNMWKNADAKVTPPEVQSTNMLLSIIHSVTFLRKGLDTDLHKVKALDLFDYHLNLKNDLGKIKSAESLQLLAALFNENPCLNEIYDIICDLAQLFALFAEYFSRLEKLKKMATLKDFAKKNPGIQHKAGVPMGGTFIVVYKNLVKAVAANDKAKEFIYQYYKAQKVDIAEAEAQPAVAAAEAAGTSASTAPVVAPSAAQRTKSKYQLISKLKGSKRTVMEEKIFQYEKGGASKEEIEMALGIVLIAIGESGLFDNETVNIKDGTVLADFYLPYPVSCGCSPVQFIVNIPSSKLSFSLKNPEYCNEDPQEYVFVANPLGGTLVSSQPNCIRVNEDGTMVFYPNKVIFSNGEKSLNVNFTYTFEDQMQTISVKVYSKPEVKITANPGTFNPLEIQFGLDKPELVDNAYWNFGDGKNSTDLKPLHVYAKGGDYIVSVKVQNGLCSYTVEGFVLTVKEPEPVLLKGLPTEICQSAADIDFIASPKGGVFTADTSFSEPNPKSGNFVFAPQKVNMGGATMLSVNFTYIAPAGNSISQNVLVYATPVGDENPDYKQVGNLKARLSFKGLATTQKIELNYGDGTVKETILVTSLPDFNAPAHVFPKAGDYTIKAVLINGTCKKDLKPFTITISPDTISVSKTCQPLSVPIAAFDKFKVKAEKSQELMKFYSADLIQVSDYFAKLAEMVKKNPNVPLSHFAQNPFIPTWIDDLPMDVTSAGRLLVIEALVVYADLISTISCLKNEDINQGNIITSAYYKALLNKVQELNKLNVTEKKAIKAIVTDADDELAKLKTNVEEAAKKDFIDALNALKDMIAKM